MKFSYVSYQIIIKVLFINDYLNSVHFSNKGANKQEANKQQTLNSEYFYSKKSI